jgi:hypothetical protein
MADQQLVAQNWDGGMQQDRSRDQLGKGIAWRMADFIPQDGAPLRKRGGWLFASTDLNVLQPGPTRCYAVAWAPFPSAGHLVAVGNTGNVYRMGPSGAINNSSGVYVGAVPSVPLTRPFWHRDTPTSAARDQLVICPGVTNSDPSRYYDSGGGSYALQPLAGSPPRGRFGFSYNQFCVLGNGWDPGSAYALRPNRLWFSNVANCDSWNTSSNGGWLDFPREIVGGGWNRSIFLIWSFDTTWLINGSTPPPGGDLAMTPLFTVGCLDGRSIVRHQDYFIWASPSAIYRTDGTTLTDITKEAGISQLWRATTTGFNRNTNWVCAAGLLYGQYYVTVIDSTGTNRLTLVIDLANFTAYTHTNIDSMMYAERISGEGTANEPGVDELFGAWLNGPRAMRLSSIWNPTISNRFDASGSPVLPTLETPYFKQGRTEEKRFRFAYVGYDLRDGGEVPKLAVGYALSPELQSYTEGTYQYPPTTRFDRQRVDIRQKSEGVSLRFRLTQPAADLRLSEIELEGHPVDGSR